MFYTVIIHESAPVDAQRPYKTQKIYINEDHFPFVSDELSEPNVKIWLTDVYCKYKVYPKQSDSCTVDRSFNCQFNIMNIVPSENVGEDRPKDYGHIKKKDIVKEVLTQFYKKSMP